MDILTKKDIRKNRRFIAICKEGSTILGEEQIWQDFVKEPLEKVIDTFLKTGYLIYTELPFDTLKKPKKIKRKLYPKTDKLYLVGILGRFRKREKKIGGNLREYYYEG